MIVGTNKQDVIKNIKEFAESGQFHSKVELNDPVITNEQSCKITDNFLENRNHLLFVLKTKICVFFINIVSKIINKNTKIIGTEKISENIKGIIITSNHFSPFENTVVRELVHKLKRKNLAIISQTSNFAMTGVVGTLMNYGDTIPISNEPRYLARGFISVLKQRLVEKGDAILLYPEQEMWYNYRKPRPVKNGAYFYAAKLNIPIVSCFVEIIDTQKDENAEFKKVNYVLHVLDVLYPDENKSVKENTENLANSDYMLKKVCYESVYNKKLTYNFENSDIAGWKGSL